MDGKELINIYEKYSKQIDDIWRSLWPRRKAKKTRRIR